MNRISDLSFIYLLIFLGIHNLIINTNQKEAPEDVYNLVLCESLLINAGV